MKRCTKCVMPETWPGIKFDEKGVCNICNEDIKQKKIDYQERRNDFLKILEYYRGRAIKTDNKYDCLIGYSGGKDTAYTLWAMVKKYKMRPLVLTFDHGFKLSDDAEYNLMEIPKILDCDHIRFTLGKNFRDSLCYEGSRYNGDFCWHCHNGVGSLPARISKQWDIPLQIWGEPSAKYQTFGAFSHSDMEEQNEEHYKKVFQSGATPEKVLPKHYVMRDMLPFQWVKDYPELKAIFLGHYEEWDQRKHVDIIIKELGWRTAKVEGTYVDWDKVDCPYEPVRDWQKWLKLGFGRTTFQASKDIREGLMNRENALRFVEELDGKKPKALQAFLKEINMTEDIFNQLTLKHKKKL